MRASPLAIEMVLSASFFSFSLVQSMIFSALPTLQRAYATDESSIAWMMTVYFTSATVCAPLIGRLGDRYGRQRLLVITLFGLACGSLIAAAAPSLPWLLLGRFVQGVGGGLVPLTFAIIHDEFSGNRLPRTFGRVVAVLAVGNSGGLLLTGPLVSVLSFRALFWVPMVMTILCGIAAHRIVPRSRSNPAVELAPASAALLTSWTIALLGALAQVQNGRLLHPGTGVLLLVAGVTFIAWLRRELTVPHPLVDIKTMSIPTVAGVNLLTFIYAAGSYGAFLALPMLLQSPEGHGFSINKAALFILPETVTSFVVSYAAGALAVRYGNSRLMTCGLVTSALAYLIIALSYTHLWLVAVGTGLMGVALGLTFAVMPSIVMGVVPADQRGVASGMNANIRTLGAAVGTAVLAATLAAGTPHYDVVFLALSALLAMSAVATRWVPSAFAVEHRGG